MVCQDQYAMPVVDPEVSQGYPSCQIMDESCRNIGGFRYIWIKATSE